MFCAVRFRDVVFEQSVFRYNCPEQPSGLFVCIIVLCTFIYCIYHHYFFCILLFTLIIM